MAYGIDPERNIIFGHPAGSVNASTRFLWQPPHVTQFRNFLLYSPWADTFPKTRVSLAPLLRQLELEPMLRGDPRLRRVVEVKVRDKLQRLDRAERVFEGVEDNRYGQEQEVRVEVVAREHEARRGDADPRGISAAREQEPRRDDGGDNHQGHPDISSLTLALDDVSLSDLEDYVVARSHRRRQRAEVPTRKQGQQEEGEQQKQQQNVQPVMYAPRLTINIQDGVVTAEQQLPTPPSTPTAEHQQQREGAVDEEAVSRTGNKTGARARQGGLGASRWAT